MGRMVVEPSSTIFLVGWLLILLHICEGQVTFLKPGEIRFDNEKVVKLGKGKGQAFCFRNRVECVEYEYEADQDILAFIVDRDEMSDTTGELVSTLNSVEGSVKIGEGNNERVKVDVETGDYCVVFVHGPFDSPDVPGAEGDSEVTIDFQIEGCPTRYQKFVAILVPIAIVIIISAIFSAWWIRRKRRMRKQAKDPQAAPGNQPNVYHPGQHAYMTQNGQIPVAVSPYHPSTSPLPSPYQGTGPYPQTNTPAPSPAPGLVAAPVDGTPQPVASQGTLVPRGEAVVPVPNVDDQQPRDPTAINAVWAAAADSRNESSMSLSLAQMDSRQMITTPYASGRLPDENSENLADSDTRV